jgi:HPr kinase/phosphorylase
MTDSIAIHATSVEIGAAAAPFGASPKTAVLLLGPSGAGKSDVALRLIAMGARLLSDDRTILEARDGVLFAQAHPSSGGQMEIRGAGIITLESAGPCPVSLAVMLDGAEPAERLPRPERYCPPPGLPILLPPPLLRLRAFEASTPAKIAAVAAALARGAFVAGVAGDP